MKGPRSLLVSMVLLMGLLAACGPTPTMPPAAPPTATPTVSTAPTAAPPQPTTAPSETYEGSVNVLAWGGYIDYAIPPFEEKYPQCKVNISYFSSAMEAINKVKAGGVGTLDVFFSTNNFFDRAIQADLVQPIDPSRLENYTHLFKAFQPGVYNERHGAVYLIPYTWGTTGLIFNRAKTGDLTSWSALWDPRFKGRVIYGDGVPEAWVPAALYVGISPEERDEAAIEKVRPALQAMMSQARALWSNGDDLVQLLVNGEGWLAVGWDGLARQAAAQVPDITYVLPQEGAQTWVDGLMLVKNAPHPNCAYRFIDWLISDEMQIQEAEINRYSPANAVAASRLDPELAKALFVDKGEESVANLKFYRPFTEEEQLRISEMWTEVKAGQ